MFVKALIVGLIAIYERLDSRILGRLNGERPLITCTIVGLLLGDLKTGLAIGAQMEMVSMGFIAIGASGYDMNLGSLIATALCIINKLDVSSALAIATIVTTLYNALVNLRSIILISMNRSIHAAIDRGDFKAAKAYPLWGGIIVNALFEFIPAFVVVYFGSGFVEKLNSMIPQVVISGLSLGAQLVCFFGFATLLNIMVSKKTWVFYFLGFLLAALGHLNLTYVAAVAIVLAFIFYHLRYGNDSGKTALAGAGVDEHDELDD